MKKIVCISLIMAFLPFGLMAQHANDDLYFIPKKKTEKETKVVEKQEKTSSSAYVYPGSTKVVVKDVEGNVRDVDEYNRRYTSSDYTFEVEDETLYIEEKPYNERGEWVNGFDGSKSDYEYAMRIVRFRNPRYAIPVSSPLYWEVIYGLPSWEWNVFNDGFYAYVFPTYSNSLWWDWRYSWGCSWGPSWNFSYNWYHPYWSYSYWHHPHHHLYWHHPHYAHYAHPHYGWAGTGGYWGKHHGINGSSVYRPGIHTGRYQNSYKRSSGTTTASSDRRVTTVGNRNSRDRYLNGSTNRTERTVRNSSGRVVTPKEGTSSSSVRPQRQVNGTRKSETIQRSNGNNRGNNASYNRQSNTQNTVRNVNTSSGRSEAAGRGTYRNSSSERSSSERRSSYESSRSSSSSRSSYSSGSERSSSRSSAGGSASRSGGSSSRGRR